MACARQGERLVVHVPPPDAAADAALMASLRAHGTVVGRLAPRLALVDVGPSADESGLSAVTGVLGVFTSAPPPAFHETLDEGERLFVDGWLARDDAAQPPDGDGVVWDADPDRLPPDPPNPPVVPPRPGAVP